MSRTAENVVDSVTDEITLQIVRGTLAPGSRLPSVRTLAATHGVNVSTVQRVLAKLEQSGLVVTRPRSGVEVRDPKRNGGTAVLPVVLRHARAERARAITILRDALATRRVLALHVARTLAAIPFATYCAAMREKVDAFAEIVTRKRTSLTDVADAENEILRTALVAADMPIVLAVVNDIGAMLANEPSVLRSFYADPGPLVSGWRAFLEMLAAGGSVDRFAFLDPFLASIDERVVAGFAERLENKAQKKEEMHERRARSEPLARAAAPRIAGRHGQTSRRAPP